MSAQQMEFHPLLQSACQLQALTARQAWGLELTAVMRWGPTPAQAQHLQWVNLVNCPVEVLTAH